MNVTALQKTSASKTLQQIHQIYTWKSARISIHCLHTKPIFQGQPDVTRTSHRRQQDFGRLRS